MGNAPEARRAPAWLGLGLVLLLALWAFGPSLGFGFVEWDDPDFLTQNPLVVDAAHTSLTDQLLTPNLGYPIPVTVTSYRIENALFGVAQAGPYHASNVVLHLLAIAVLFLLARRFGLSALGATLCCTLFALHPAVAESVSWVTGRKDLLATLGTLAAVAFAQQALRVPERTRAFWSALIASAVCCVLALLSKPTGAVAPVVAGATLLLQRRRREGVLLVVKVYALPVLITLASIPAALLHHEAIHGHRDVAGVGAWLREIWYALGYHLGIIGMVRPNAAKYLPPWPPPFDASVDLLPLLVIALVVLLYRALKLREHRAVAIGLVLAVSTYLPSSNVIPLTRITADAYVHCSLAGLGLFLGAVLDAEQARLPRFRALWIAVTAMVALVLAVEARGSSARFFDSYSLWAADYEQFPNDYRLCRNRANGAYQRLGPQAALEHYRACAQRFGPEAFQRNEALMLVELGRFDEAEPLLRQLLQQAPDDVAVRRRLELIERSRHSRQAP